MLNSFSWSYPKGINLVKPENLHLTLLFIGDTDEQEIPAIKAVIRECISEVNAFELRMLGIELFPSVSPRLVWAKLDTQTRDIFLLAKDLGKKISELKVQPDIKSLKLHITLGRIRQQQSPEAERLFISTTLPAETAAYDTVTLYQSVLLPTGPVYKPIETYKI